MLANNLLMSHFLPEIILSTTLCIALLATVYGRCKKMPYGLTQLGLLTTLLSLFWMFPSHHHMLFSDMYQVTPGTTLIKIVMVFLTSLLLVLAPRTLNEKGMAFGEFFVLISLSLLGMMVMVSANHFLVLYLGLELYTLPLMAMIALRRDEGRCQEAAMKYFTLSALSSGILLYGVSLLFGALGTLSLTSMGAAIAHMQGHELLLLFSLVFIITGMAFKLGMIPFHMWVPDVYEGAPTLVVLFMSSVPKIAALALTLRILSLAMPSLMVHWQSLFLVLAVLSMLLGNLVAIAQTNLKRLLAYSSIAHMGYMSLGVIAGTPEGFHAAMFYAVTYALMSMAAFGMLIALNQQGIVVETLDDLKGLSSQHRLFAFLMLMIVFSMAGIPPFVGFFAKLTVLMALVHAHLVWLALFALVCAIIGAYYYLRMIRNIYFEPSTTDRTFACHWGEKIVLSATAFSLLILGIFPGVLLNLMQL